MRTIPIALALALLPSCTAVLLEEDPALGGCTDGVDNDLDGTIDGADGECMGGGGESTMTACRNGADDDMDSRIDCQDGDCLAGGHCDAFRQDDCDFIPGAGPGSGCPTGMTCYGIDPNFAMRECRLSGMRNERGPCRIGGYTPRDAHDCAPDFYCLTFADGTDSGNCVRICDDEHRMCEPFSGCFAAPGSFGRCLAVCDPRAGVASGCPAGFRCRGFGELPTAMPLGWAGGDMRFQCVDQGFGIDGTAAADAACNEMPITTTSPSQVCASGLICMPGSQTGLAGPTCRTICDATTMSGCAGGERCVTIYDGAGGADGNDFVQVGYLGTELGYCRPI